MAAAAAPAAAAEAAEITYGRLRVTTATRGCSCYLDLLTPETLFRSTILIVFDTMLISMSCIQCFV